MGTTSEQLCQGCFDARVNADPQLAEQLRTAESTATQVRISTTTITATRGFRPYGQTQRERPYVIYALMRCFVGKIGFGPPPWKINWAETMTEVVARFLVGVCIGAGLCVLLVPTFFWPGKSAPPHTPAAKRGFYANFPEAVPWIFGVIFLLIVCGWMATTRVVLKGTGDLIEEFGL